MNTRRYVAGRIGWSVFALWAILTATFLLFVVYPDFKPGGMTFGMSPEESAKVIARYREQMHYNDPLWQRYLHWMKVFATLDWGTSYVQGRPTKAIIGEAAPVTALYLVPSIVLSGLLGTALGLYSSVQRSGVVRRLRDVFVYLGLALPAFWLGEVLLVVAAERVGFTPAWNPEAPLLSGGNLAAMALPVAVTTLSLTALQARYTHAETAEYVVADFAKTIRASGGSSLTVARHALRNAMVPLLSLFVTQSLTMLLLSVYVVESVFNLPGLGLVTLNAIEQRDIAVILGTMFVTVLVGLFGNLLQDLAYGVFDPRAETRSE